MMKIIITVLIVFGLTISSFCQNISFPTNATWSDDYGVYDQSFPPQPPIHNYKYYKTNGDTIINGYTYTIIGTPYSSNYCNLRDSSGFVFCKYNYGFSYDTIEFVLFNYNLSLGDSISIPRIGNPITYEPGTVYAIDSFLIGFQAHKRIRISASWSGSYLDFIEGVGSLQGLLYPENGWIDSWNDLYCFSKNDTVMYKNFVQTYHFGNCWLTTNVEDKKLINEVTNVYPNPTSGNINIDLKEVKQDIKATITNSLGQVIFIQNFEATNLISIDIDAPSGIYFLNLKSDRESKTIKVLKE